jgi:hypothetical protein
LEEPVGIEETSRIKYANNTNKNNTIEHGRFLTWRDNINECVAFEIHNHIKLQRMVREEVKGILTHD